MIHNITYDVQVDSTSRDIISLEFNEGYKTPISKLQFETESASVDWLGKEVSASLTIGTKTDTIFTGYVDNVSFVEMPGIYEVTCSNILIRARNYWIVTSSLEEPWTRKGIAAEDLVGDLLSEAGLTNYSGDTSGFTFGTSSPVEFNLTAVMDAIDQINNILAYNIWAEGSTVYWDRVLPDPAATADYTYNDVFISINKTEETRNLRNKVVVFGKDGIYAEESASSPYLPEDFYQTAIVSSELIDSQSMANEAVTYNLELYNRLGQELRVDMEGDPRVKVRDTVHITYPTLSIDSNWFVYSVRHTLGETYTTSLNLRK
jgi:hypothetical protein